LKAGDCFGEMSVISLELSSANIVARAPSTVRLMQLSDLPLEGGVRELVTGNLARTLVRRLSRANGEIQARHQREMKAMQAAAAASAFITRILTALTLYMFSLPFVSELIPLIPTDSLISFFFVVMFSWVVLNFMYRLPSVRAQYWFMTTAHWPRQIARGVLWSIPLMLVFTALKLTVMHVRPGEFEFFEPMAAIARHKPMNFPFWLTIAFVYMTLCFGQEFIRCATQGTLELINAASFKGGHWKAILISDVLFASLHMHMGPAFAVQAFVAGLFFGYTFYRERSYLTTAVSHSVVGVFAVFIAGIPR
jgi:membrane protease YdiL (CAAX protease family)